MELVVLLDRLATVAASIALFHAGMHPGAVGLRRRNLAYQLAQQLVLALVLIVLIGVGVGYRF